jgi:hypothetical protein
MKRFRIRTQPAAEAHLVEIRAWWEEHRPELESGRAATLEPYPIPLYLFSDAVRWAQHREYFSSPERHARLPGQGSLV